jgi:hypothetical protein
LPLDFLIRRNRQNRMSSLMEGCRHHIRPWLMIVLLFWGCRNGAHLWAGQHA